MNPRSFIALCLALAPLAAQAQVRTDDIGMVAGHLPEPGDPAALLDAITTAPVDGRSLPFLAFARALYAAGYWNADAFIPSTCDARCTAANMADLLESDRQAISGAVAATPRDTEAEPTQAADPRTGRSRVERLRAAIALFNIGWGRSKWGEFLAAERIQVAALATLQTQLPAGDVRVAAMRLGVARTVFGLGRTAEAILLADEVLAIEAKAGRRSGQLSAEALTLRARAARKLGRSAAAEATLIEAIGIGTADRARRGPLRLTAAQIDAAIATIGAAGFEAVGVDAEAFTRLKRAIATNENGLLEEAEGDRKGLLARVLLDRGDDRGALPLARAAVALAPQNTTAALALGIAELRAGPVDVERLDDIASILDQQAWGPGAGSPDVIEARALLARLYGTEHISAAWVHVRQGATGAMERILGDESREDVVRAAAAFRSIFRQKVDTAWAAALAPPPSWPDDARSFSIFFDIDRYDITSSAMPALERAAATWRRLGGTITVAGNVDQMGGTRDYAIALSSRLANAAQRALEQLGVPPSAIVTIGFGKERPLVQREDRLAERRNRRVDITIAPAH
jgi:outer membrane protein OmpA-like peptidoglycan-associated protein